MITETKTLTDKLITWAFSLTTGLVTAIESTTVDFLIPCIIIIVLDIFSAIELGKRIKKADPINNPNAGKFKSRFKYETGTKMIYLFCFLIVAFYLDNLIYPDSRKAQMVVFITFITYESISILENFASCNGSAFARVLRKILVSKAEKYIEAPGVFEEVVKSKSNEINLITKKDENNKEP